MEKLTVAMIPARGGSKGIPDKNLAKLGGETLLARAIKQCGRIPSIDHILVSTDSLEIARVAKAAGASVPFIRPPELAGDDSSALSVALHCIDFLESAYGEGCVGIFLLVQVTSPFRPDGVILESLEYLRAGVAAVVGMKEVKENPAWTFTISREGLLDPKGDSIPVRRQDLPSLGILNGAIYGSNVEFLRENKGWIGEGTKPVFMSELESLDIDEPIDLAFARFLLDNKIIS